MNGILCSILILSIWSIKCTVTDEAKLYSCMTCIDLGNDCRSHKIEPNCEFCGKAVGIVQKESEVPEWAKKLVQNLSPGVRIADYEGKKIAIRGCAFNEFLEQAGFEKHVGCHTFNKFGLKGHACLCRSDCKLPIS